MNSLTPVSSLTATAEGPVNQVAERLPADDERKALLDDAAEALEILTRRSEGLLHFVLNQRRLTKHLVANYERLKLKRVFGSPGILCDRVSSPSHPETGSNK